MAFLFFAAVAVLLGWLVCEYDVFATVPAAAPHTTSSSSSPSPPGPADPPTTPQPNRRARRAHARSLSRSPPPVPDWARPGSLLAPPRQQAPPTWHHVPAASRDETFLNVESTEQTWQMKRVEDPVTGWRWVGARRDDGELVSLPCMKPNVTLPVPVVIPRPPISLAMVARVPDVVGPVLASKPPVKTVLVLPPPQPRRAAVAIPSEGGPSVATLLAGIPSRPQGLVHVFPVEAPAPQPWLSAWVPSLAVAPSSVQGPLTVVLPSFVPSVPVPSVPLPPPAAPRAEVEQQPRSEAGLGFAALPSFSGLNLPAPVAEAAGQSQSGAASGIAVPPPPPTTIPLSAGPVSGPGADAGSGAGTPTSEGGFVAPLPPTSLSTGPVSSPGAGAGSGAELPTSGSDVVVPPPPAPLPISFDFGPGSGFGAPGPANLCFGSGSAAPPTAPSFPPIFSLPATIAMSSLSTTTTRRGVGKRGAGSSSRGAGPAKRSQLMVNTDVSYAPRLSEESDFKYTLKHNHPFDTAGFVNDAHIMSARYQDVCMDGLADMTPYVPGSTLSAFEHNLREKESGLRKFALLVCWQVDTGKPQPAGGSTALKQLMAVLAQLDGLVHAFVADGGGRQAEFERGEFGAWGRSWRFLVQVLCEERGEALRALLDPAALAQLEDGVGRNQAHWGRFRPSTNGRHLLNLD
ncbi:galactonate dehydratase [Pyrenophora seminiperda CCB06]|uniref:Galactonate dehydratase n=1 Tax=Pyrenophora seminiperda CCB06 TaxID=1302712 RepID=A0A3M7M667_9PLEO|nr:galactonate dehydratase [Pyrenophora seminiperda CCB06]